MKRLLIGMGLAVLTAGAPLQAVNEIKVIVTNSGTPTTTYHDANAAFSVGVSSTTTLINITAVDGVSGVGVVTITGSGSSDLKVFYGSGAFPTTGLATTAECGDIGGLTVSNSTQRAATSLAGHIKEDVEGSVIVGKLYRFDADGAIKSTFQAALPGGTGLFIVNAASTSAGASITCDSGDISKVETTSNCAGAVSATDGDILLVKVGGDLTATVRASDGRIVDILVTGGIDIAPGSSSSIRSKEGASRITCATISSQTTISLIADNGTGALGLLKVSSGGIPNGCHVHVKSLTLPDTGSESGIIVNGDMNGLITIQNGGTVSQPIWIGGSLGSNGVIGYYYEFGLTNQIIINGDDVGGTWSGNVRMDYDDDEGGAYNITPKPYYPGASSTYGGGAVGLATFHLYDDDCQPVNGGSHAFTGTTTVVLSFYGPIGWDTNYTDPVAVSYRLAGTSTWVPLPGTDFSCQVSGRFLTVTAITNWDFADDFDYRIESVDGALYSQVPSTPDVDFTYTISGQ
ncbi:MAG: hypothetical protein IT437_04240 [Phycisphaerales bacterium]|nr:hypothetical protein [Phycisphaerales bacterium]